MKSALFNLRYFELSKLCAVSLFVAVMQLLICNSSTAEVILGVSPETSRPVHTSQGAAPLVLLTVARDHSLYFPAYNDMSDINNDGGIEVKFNPNFIYFGLFNPLYCYKYQTAANNNKNDDYFYPNALANPQYAANGPMGCNPATKTLWSGNWLNYVTTSRIDAMRVALYGGQRDVDDTGTTILRRAYIPQDGHAWAKAYKIPYTTATGTPPVYTNHSITYYAPFNPPTSGLQHFFGNLTSTVSNGISRPLLSYKKDDVATTDTVYVTGFGEAISSADDVGQSCSNLNTCSSYPPLLRVITNSGTNVWNWASSQRPTLDYHPYPIRAVSPILPALGANGLYPKGNSVGFGNLDDDIYTYPAIAPELKDHTVRVRVCVLPYIDSCKAYSYVNDRGETVTTYKPTGVLQDYGDNNSVMFGLMTGSYDKNLSGGRIRKNISSFQDEIDLKTGIFKTPGDGDYFLVDQLNKLRIRNFNNPTENQDDSGTRLTVPNYYNRYYGNNFIYRNTWSFNKNFKANGNVMDDGDYGDWGNPIAEMMFEGLRYFAGGPDFATGIAGATPIPTTAFNGDITEDAAVGLKNPAWRDPYGDATKWCAKPNIVVVSGPNPSFDSDQLPGSPFNPSGFEVELKNVNGAMLNVATATKYVGEKERLNGTNRLIGEKRNDPVDADRNPTVKTNISLESIRGLVPDQTDSQGSFLSAGVAYFGKQYPLRTVNSKNIPTVDTYAMVLNPPFPGIKIPNPVTGKQTITITPFAKTQTQRNSTLGQQRSSVYMPTNQLVGLYISEVTNADNKTGNFAMTFYAVFEDSAWGGDFEMDYIVKYIITADRSTGTVAVSLTPPSQNASALQNAGYVISGTTKDGPYIEVQSIAPDPPSAFYLNTPINYNNNGISRPPYYCIENFDSDECKTVKTSTTPYRTHTAAAKVAGSIELKDPLWYAARWGGYKDPVELETPLPEGSTPNNYVQVYSSANFKASFQKMIQSIISNSATLGAVASTSQQTQSSSKLFTTTYDYNKGFGELTASTFTLTPGIPSDSIKYDWAWDANDKIGKWSDRKIYYPSKGTNKLIDFNSSNLYDTTKGWDTLYLFGPDAAAAKDAVDYVRGDRSNEISLRGVLRNRFSVLGPVINSSPVYSQETGDVYVGANDGMLHAFDAESGAEKFAYIPTPMITTATAGKSILHSYSQPSFKGRYFVDGSIAVSQMAKKDPNMVNGYTYLMGFLGRGGRGYFLLKVNTDTGLPDTDTNNGTIIENFYSAAIPDRNLGYILGEPVIERILDSPSGLPVTVAIFGNGYDSDSRQAALYVVRLYDGEIIAKYLTCTGGTGVAVDGNCATSYDTSMPNGMGTPGIVRDKDYATHVYVGDYRGNVWKIKLPTYASRPNFTDVKRYLAPGDQWISKVFTTPVLSSNPQPIVAPVTTAYSYDSTDISVKNKQFIFFGTGSDLTTADLNSTQRQSLYGFIPSGSGVMTRDELTVRTMSDSSTYAGYKTGQTLNVRTSPANVPNDMGTPPKGWYMDWPIRPVGASEKVFTAATVRRGITPTLVVSSSIANSGSCVADGAGYLNAFDAYHGGGLAGSYFDINRNGSFDDEKVGGAPITSIDFGIGSIGQAGFSGNNVIVQGSGPSPNKATDNFGDVGLKASSKVSRRISWREITN